MKTIIGLVLALLTLPMQAQILSGVLNVQPNSGYYVDAITPGSDSNPGTSGAPWATLTHAAATISATAPLYLKYPDGSWQTAPPATIWPSIVSYYPFIQGSSSTTLYDVANGTHGAAAGTLTWTGLGALFGTSASEVNVSGSTINQPDTITTLYFRLQPGAGSRGGQTYDSQTSSNRQTMWVSGYAPTGIKVQANGSSATYTQSGLSATYPWVNYSTAFGASGSNSTLYQNGTSVLTAALGTGPLNAIRIGNSYNASSSYSYIMSGLMINSIALGTSQQAALNTWLNNVEVPRTHQPAGFTRLSSNGLAVLPPMGWNSWNTGLTPTDTLLRATADAMISTGMAASGYQYVNVDDKWQASSRSGGTLQPNATNFPNGMTAVATYIHGQGLKFGIYSSPGLTSCAGYPASYGYEVQDANTFASWGVDYLKYDFCYAGTPYASLISTWRELGEEYIFQIMGAALQATGRPILYSINDGNATYAPDAGEWFRYAGANMHRVSSDVSASYASITQGYTPGNALYSGPGAWGDSDMLQIGNTGVTDIQGQSQMSHWAMLSSPLLAGNDIRSMSANTKATLTNPDVIAVDQDALGIQAVQVSSASCGSATCQVWAKQLTGTNKCAIELANLSSTTQSITATFATIAASVPACGSGPYTTTYNLWANWPSCGATGIFPGGTITSCKGSMGTLTTSYTAASVPANGVVMFTVAP